MLLLRVRLLHVRLVQIAEASPRLEVPPSSSISAVVMIHCRLLHVKVLRSRRTVRLGRHVEVLKVMRGPRRRHVANRALRSYLAEEAGVAGGVLSREFSLLALPSFFFPPSFTRRP